MKANCMKKKDFVDLKSRTKSFDFNVLAERSFDFNVLAERKGLEPSASGVTGRRYNRLNYRSASVHRTQEKTSTQKTGFCQ